MSMELEFLTIGDYQHKDMCLQHINEMINIKLHDGDTYNNLFEKLRKHFSEMPKKLKAVENWITFNKEQQEDESVFETILHDNDAVEYYAAFNLRA